MSSSTPTNIRQKPCI